MKKIGYIILVMLTLAAAVGWGEESLEDKDPFYPSWRRPVVKSPADATSSGIGSAGTSTWGRDPFNNPFTGKAIASKEPVHASRGKGLTGIICSPDVRLAIINGETFREGSMVGDRKLVDIRKSSVVFLNAAGGREEEFLENFSIRK